MGENGSQLYAPSCAEGRGKGHREEAEGLTGTFQEPTGNPFSFLKHGYVSQTLAFPASRSQPPGGLSAPMFPVGSAGSRITGLKSNVREGHVRSWAVSGGSCSYKTAAWGSVGVRVGGRVQQGPAGW